MPPTVKPVIVEAAGPAGAAFAYAVRQHGEGDRREAHADDVQMRRVSRRDFRQIFIPENEGDNADRQIDDENPVPADRIDQPAG